MKYIIGTFAVLFFLITSCSRDKGLDPDLQVKTTSICDSVKYSTTILPIINANCISCHTPGGSGPGDFTTYAGVKLKVDNGTFKTRVIDLNPTPMPPTGVLPTADIEAIKCWLNAGAPNN